MPELGVPLVVPVFIFKLQCFLSLMQRSILCASGVVLASIFIVDMWYVLFYLR